MKFSINFLLFILFISLFDRSRTENNNKEICLSKNIYNTYSKILDDIFLKFSYSNESFLIKKKLFAANVTEECLSKRQTNLSSQSSNATLNQFISAITDNVIIPYCADRRSNLSAHIKNNLSSAKMWIYGFISVTVINACAGLGILFIPMMNKKFYKVIMTFMISLAVGSLTGSALLILIPDAMQLTELQEAYPGFRINYKYKATVVFGGLYMFFLLERFLKWIINKKVSVINRERLHSHGSINISRTPKPKYEIDQLSVDRPSTMLPEIKTTINNHSNNKTDNQLVDDNANPTDIPEVKILKNSKKKSVAPVAWMIIFGDALHNFIDGLSIGAAFSRNTMTGISLSIAVICEELPHELGDFAILLHAGMKVKQALMWNMLSAATCYLGFILGVILGETTTSSTWVFAIAGGMFLYISLVDMMPEMNATLEDKDCKEIIEFGIFKTFVIQNIGLLVGYCLLLIMALYGDKISLK